MERLNLRYLGVMNYKLEIPDSTLHYPQSGSVLKMLELKRNDVRTLNVLVKDNFGRGVNLLNSNIKFVMKSKDPIMGPDGDKVVKADQEAITILDQLKSQNVGEFQLLMDEECTACAGEFRAEFQLQLKGIVSSTLIGPYALNDEDTLSVTVDGEEQIITFSMQDFADIQSATIEEVVATLNAQLVGASASILQANVCPAYILLSSSAEEGSVQVSGGSALDLFRFDTSIHRDQKITLPPDNLLVIIREDLDETGN